MSKFPVLHHSVAIANNTTNAVAIPARPDRIICVTGYTMNLKAGGDNTIVFKSANSTIVSQEKEYSEKGGMVGVHNPDGHFQTKKGEALTANTGNGGSPFSIDFTYELR